MKTDSSNDLHPTNGFIFTFIMQLKILLIIISAVMTMLAYKSYTESPEYTIELTYTKEWNGLEEIF